MSPEWTRRGDRSYQPELTLAPVCESMDMLTGKGYLRRSG
jgi:hypothetical protein